MLSLHNGLQPENWMFPRQENQKEIPNIKGTKMKLSKSYVIVVNSQ